MEILNAHRGGLATEVAAIRPSPDLFERVGGREKLRAIIDDFYERLVVDPLVRPLFRDALEGDRRNQKLFFEEWMGGEPAYMREIGGPGTGPFHDGFQITRPRAGRWLALMTTTLREHGVAQETIRDMMRVLGPMAQALTRRRDLRPLTPRARRAAVRGDVDALQEMIDEDARIFADAPREASHCLFRAARAGNLDVVRFFVEQDVDLNRPFSAERTQLIPWHIAKDFVLLTPWCVAKLSDQDEIADYLQEQGAVVDIFSLAYLGDAASLRTELDDRPALAVCTDPATDHRDVTPMHHAVRARRQGVVEILREFGAPEVSLQETTIRT